MIFPLNPGDQFLDVVQIHPLSQSHPVRPGPIGPSPRRCLNRLKSGSKRFIDYPTEWRIQPLGRQARPIEDIVVNRQCCSHT